MINKPSLSPGATASKRAAAEPPQAEASEVRQGSPAEFDGDLAVVQFDGNGHIISASARGMQLLEQSFPEMGRKQVAPVLMAWAREETARVLKARKQSTPPCRLQLGKSRCVVIYLHPSLVADVFEIHLEESVSYSLEAQGAGLTSRERDVLYWIGQGKRNGEIGIILGISSKTVNKHAERIFAKLGVETRGAAANMILGELRQANPKRTSSKGAKKSG